MTIKSTKLQAGQYGVTHGDHHYRLENSDHNGLERGAWLVSLKVDGEWTDWSTVEYSKKDCLATIEDLISQEENK